MTKFDQWMIFSLSLLIFGTVNFLDQSIFSDQNEFLKDFVNHEFLNFMAVIVTITLGFSANTYVNLVQKEARVGQEVFTRTKRAIKTSALFLLGGLAASVILCVVKPLLPDKAVYEGIANLTCLHIILFGIFVLYDMTKLALKA